MRDGYDMAGNVRRLLPLVARVTKFATGYYAFSPYQLTLTDTCKTK